MLPAHVQAPHGVGWVPAWVWVWGGAEVTPTEIRQLITTNARLIVDTFDAHEVGIDTANGHYLCACGWRGPEADWYPHLGEALGDKLTETVVELPGQLVLA